MLEDPWIKEQAEKRNKEVLSDIREQASHMKEIFEFSNYNKFSKTITSLLLGLRQDFEDIVILKELFHKIDENNDGTISIEEFVKASNILMDEEFF